jgi:hypothetical protein
VLTRGGKGTNSAKKNQLLYERFGINYNDVPERMRKGSAIVREEVRDLLLWMSSSADACQQGCYGGWCVGTEGQREREEEGGVDAGYSVALRPHWGRVLEGAAVYSVGGVQVGLLSKWGAGEFGGTPGRGLLREDEPAGGVEPLLGWRLARVRNGNLCLCRQSWP